MFQLREMLLKNNFRDKRWSAIVEFARKTLYQSMDTRRQIVDWLLKRYSCDGDQKKRWYIDMNWTCTDNFGQEIVMIVSLSSSDDEMKDLLYDTLVSLPLYVTLIQGNKKIVLYSPNDDDNKAIITFLDPLANEWYFWSGWFSVEIDTRDKIASVLSRDMTLTSWYYRIINVEEDDDLLHLEPLLI